MKKWSMNFIIYSIFISLMASSPIYAQQNCSTYSFNNNNSFSTCINLPVLNSFLHWTYHQANHTVDIAYRHTDVTASNWVAWALNPNGQGMLQAQCLVAFQNSSSLVHAYTSSISSLRTTLEQSPLSFEVPRLAAEFGNNEMIIFASLQLPTGRTSFNQVWQVGPVSGDTIVAHDTAPNSPSRSSTGTVDFATGQATAGGGAANSLLRRRNVHGVLNAVSWGVLMPLGAVIARYLKVFKSANPAWFYLHIACQVSAYTVGVAGWSTGLKLGSDSVGITHSTHRNIGITLFCLGTLQVFALLLRPKPDHKYRFYWNIYHYATGYTVIILSIVNIFEGFEILDPEKKWKNAYIGILIAIGVIAAILEALTWFIVIKRKRDGSSTAKYPHNGVNGVNGVNAYGARPQNGV